MSQCMMTADMRSRITHTPNGDRPQGDRTPLVRTTTALLIMGMKDNSCRETVAEVLAHVDGVGDVHVNLYRGRAIISHELHCKTAHLITAVARAGYSASPLPHGPLKKLSRVGSDVRGSREDIERNGCCDELAEG